MRLPFFVLVSFALNKLEKHPFLSPRVCTCIEKALKLILRKQNQNVFSCSIPKSMMVSKQVLYQKENALCEFLIHIRFRKLLFKYPSHDNSFMKMNQMDIYGKFYL